MRKEFRDNNPTSERFCRDPIEMSHIARTYVTYSQNVKMHKVRTAVTLNNWPPFLLTKLFISM